MCVCVCVYVRVCNMVKSTLIQSSGLFLIAFIAFLSIYLPQHTSFLIGIILFAANNKPTPFRHDASPLRHEMSHEFGVHLVGSRGSIFGLCTPLCRKLPQLCSPKQ